tara:strand:- start:54 stop:182 length:129 start_codon:yes stop_codon:yes gene_type:complete
MTIKKFIYFKKNRDFKEKKSTKLRNKSNLNALFTVNFSGYKI